MKRLLALALLAACGGGTDPVDYDEPRTTPVASLPGVPWPALDVLVVVDDSVSTAHFQKSLGDYFDRLLDPLLAAAATTDLHVGVTTSDMGTSGGPTLGQVGNGGCTATGKDGQLLVTNGAPVTGSFLADAPGMQTFTGDRHDALSLMFEVGSGGCGFEQPLHAATRAFSNPMNAGFERPNANLLVLDIQDEDDCSFTNPALVGSDDPALGPLQSYRCTQFGVTCDEPTDEVGDKHHCHSDEQSPYLSPVRPSARALRDRKSDPSRMVFATIAGTVEPFQIELRAPPNGGTAILSLAHSCSWSLGDDGTNPTGLVVADPPVRMRDATDELGPHGLLTSVCQTDLTPSLASIARVAKQMYGIACLDTSTLRDSDTAPGIQPMCYATEERDGASAELPACPADGDCVEVIADPTACAETADHLRLNVRYATPPTAATYVRARCEVP